MGSSNGLRLLDSATSAEGNLIALQRLAAHLPLLQVSQNTGRMDNCENRLINERLDVPYAEAGRGTAAFLTGGH